MNRLALFSALSALVFCSALDAEAAKVFRPSKARVTLVRASQSLARVGQRMRTLLRPKALLRGTAIVTMAAALGACATIQVPVDGAPITKAPDKGSVELVIPSEKLPSKLQDKLHEMGKAAPEVAKEARSAARKAATGDTSGLPKVEVKVTMPGSDAPITEPIVIDMKVDLRR